MILVTGGAGYIGSHCVLALLKQGYDVVIYDNLSTGHLETVNTLKKYGNVIFYQGDLLNSSYLNTVFRQTNIDAVIHFAAFAQVGESVENPAKYYRNNVVGTLNLLDAMISNNVKKIVFSSTCATYGNPDYVPVDENHPQKPVSPYGMSKLMVEKIMEDYDRAYGLKSIKLRYFNVAGCDKECRVGEWHEPETHLIPNILKSLFGEKKTFKIFGDDYNTPDGTCIRDYVNVEDLVNAHILALKYLEQENKSDVFNLGTEQGDSVKNIFDACERVLNKKIPVEVVERRAGDAEALYANANKVKSVLGWQPQKSIDDSIKTAYAWENSLTKEHQYRRN